MLEQVGLGWLQLLISNVICPPIRLMRIGETSPSTYFNELDGGERLGNLGAIPKPFGFKVSCLPVKVRNAGAGWSRVVAIID